MKTFKLALAGLAALGAAIVAAPEPAKAGGLTVSFGFGHGGYHGYGYRPYGYGYGYRPVHYGYYHRPYVRRVSYGYPHYYHRPYARRVVYRSYPRHYGYYRPHRVRYISYGHPRHGWQGHRGWRGHRGWW